MPLPAVSVLALLTAIDLFEIQVYEGEINDPGQAGIELHTNYVGRGRSTAAFAGELVPDRRLNMTLEPSFGLLRWWELGAYLQMAAAPGRSAAAFGGIKVRSKIVAPRVRTAPFIVGVNVEVAPGSSRQPRSASTPDAASRWDWSTTLAWAEWGTSSRSPSKSTSSTSSAI